MRLWGARGRPPNCRCPQGGLCKLIFGGTSTTTRREKGEKEESGVAQEKNQNIVGRFLSSGDHLPDLLVLIWPHFVLAHVPINSNQWQGTPGQCVDNDQTVWRRRPSDR